MPANKIHQAVATFHLSDKGYGLNQLRYDLRKLTRDFTRCVKCFTLALRHLQGSESGLTR